MRRSNPKKLPRANVIGAALLVSTAMLGSTSAYAWGGVNTQAPARINTTNAPIVKAKSQNGNVVETAEDKAALKEIADIVAANPIDKATNKSYQLFLK